MCGQDKQTVRLATYYTILYVVSKNNFIEKRLSIYVDPIDDSHEIYLIVHVALPSML